MVVLIFKQLLVAEINSTYVYSNTEYYNDWQLSIKKIFLFSKIRNKTGKKEVIHKCPGVNSQKVTPSWHRVAMAEAL